MSHDRLQEIERKACADPCFTDAEKSTIRELIRVYRGWQFFGKIVRGAVVVLGGVAGAVTAVKAIMGAL